MKMILMLTADRQIDRRILYQADSLESLGHKVIILAMPHQEINEDKRVIRCGQKQQLAKKPTFFLKSYQFLRQNTQFSTKFIPFFKKIAWRWLINMEKFYGQIFLPDAMMLNCDIVIAHDLPMLPIACQVAQKNHARLIYDNHELFSEQYFSQYERKKWQAIEKKYIGCCDEIIAVNQSIADELTKRYNLNIVHSVTNAIPYQECPKQRIFHEKYQLPADSKIILYQGGLSVGRNCEILLDAMQILPDNFKLVFLGDGDIKAKLQKLCAQSKLKNIYFHQAVPQNKLMAYTASADLGVIPYQANCLNNYYCTPNKLFEFIMARIPILASDLPQLKHFISDNHIGKNIDFSNPAIIAKNIQEILNNIDIFQEPLNLSAKKINWGVESQKYIKIILS